MVTIKELWEEIDEIQKMSTEKDVIDYIEFVKCTLRNNYLPAGEPENDNF